MKGKNLLATLRLIRLPNLLMLAGAQVLARWCLIIPAFRTEYFITNIFPDHLSAIEFTLLVLSTAFIAAAGYIINDAFDVQTDAVNKPGKNLVGSLLSIGKAKRIFGVLGGAGIMLGIFLSIRIGKPQMGLLHVFSVFTLYLYSSNYKKVPFVGNFLVAALCALSLLLVGLFEPEFYRNINYLMWFVVMAFLLSLVREIIKDMEDVSGDEMAGARTLPIAIGIRRTKIIVHFFLLLTAAYVAWIIYNNFQSNSIISIWYMMAMFIIPLAGLFYLVASAGSKKDFHYASLFAKLILLGGILTMVPFYFYFLT